MSNEMMMVINCVILVLSLGNILLLMKENRSHIELLNETIIHPASLGKYRN
jgi:hypothetical protein